MRARKTICHVNQLVIRRNLKLGTTDPPITVKQGRTNRYAQEVIIEGPSRLVYRPDKPLSCGARLWLETWGDVTLVGEQTVPSAKRQAPNKSTCPNTFRVYRK